MKYEEYIITIAPFEDFKSRANIKYVTICNKLDNALSREPEVVIIIDGYVGMIHPFPISKIKKV